eukprot:TRINITY_DN131_c5_g1_i1.p1 TRINITY_DN131_c5_g1~~TRINITY_DN131_c5_g1_i1.p1  ORF type:complete len:325 (-),score=124.69 TRINITY_DN131_c5_g1_i1:333-1307(-)
MSTSSASTTSNALDEIETTQILIKKVNAYEVPTRSSASGYSANDWKRDHPIWTGRLRTVIKGDKCSILLEHTDREGLFAVCHYTNPSVVEPVLDSSRYFVLRISDNKGRVASIGISFEKREEAFDFKVALQDASNMNIKDREKKIISDLPSAGDLSLQTGEKLHLNIGGSTTTTTKKSASSSTTTSTPSSSTISKFALSLGPPPGSSKTSRRKQNASSSSSSSSALTSATVATSAPTTSTNNSSSTTTTNLFDSFSNLTLSSSSASSTSNNTKSNNSNTSKPSSSNMDDFLTMFSTPSTTATSTTTPSSSVSNSSSATKDPFTF